MGELTIHKNKIKEAKSGIILSIVTPVYKNDPSPLLDKLLFEINNNAGFENTELLIVDDGSQSVEITSIITERMNEAKIPYKFIEFHKNRGRSLARNSLIENSKGEYILFLDSDMLPDCDDFIRKWLEFIENTAPTIAYGGYSLKQVPNDKKLALGRALASSSDCLSAEERNFRGPIAVATSNLLVRRDIVLAVPFDCGFVGWGWEDVDWALRANQAEYAIVHFENPATHMGIDEPEIILKKFKFAGPNFKHITERHPEMLSLKSTKAARLLAKFSILTKLAPLTQMIAMNDNLPISLRSKSARAWRAIWAAKSLNGEKF